ncbi:ribosome-associated heat shock protein Hsp15 [Meinhardsimonia xiamenensis]|uniref:Ribosome-associated heat shock protein Hsp15 n=1 Tax=Meinhardsimonia xiamenensis TaxID=990712 RepID=A0A1G9B6G6_9RHOB|nr:RNA-binding S4 domain-containing protein [Meinhardsimonia xiamenensis]PRX35101.1 ribosome-associated heat shock protein Hsp15 [Meinhardsimonia xiamenensis]SDK35132.1 ribosome-associated heat shock protein Hsp15 [Meinhardsimonia xiamenensis]
MEETPQRLRLDKWLWQARFFKTRSLAARVVAAGHVRVNSRKVSKPAQSVAPGDTLTFPQARAIRVVRILALGERRGPASEARALYEDLSPPASVEPAGAPHREAGGRPTKKARRAMPQRGGSALE